VQYGTERHLERSKFREAIRVWRFRPTAQSRAGPVLRPKVQLFLRMRLERARTRSGRSGTARRSLFAVHVDERVNIREWQPAAIL